MEVGGRVQVKWTNNEKVPYSGHKGTVVSVDSGFNYPNEIKLDDIILTIFYTDKELKVL